MAHRKVDVDVFEDEDAFVDVQTTQTQSPQELEQLVTSRQGQVRQLLSRQVSSLYGNSLNGYRGSLLDALKKSLELPPFNKDAEDLKNLNTQTVMEVLVQAKTSDMTELIKSLNPQEFHVLFKYIYKGMSLPNVYNSMILLAWHEKAVECGGIGSIVRVLTDRQVV